MGINNIMQNVMSTKWSWTDDFEFFFYNNKVQLQNTPVRPDDMWDMCVTNIDTSDAGSTNNAVVQAGKYRLTTQMYGTFSVTVTFRDIYGMELKNYFWKIWQEQQTAYFDEIKSTIKIGLQGELFFESDECLIDNISQSQIDNSNTQIVEFSVQFICSSYKTNRLQYFGKKAI
jgi:hypothetical protein